MDHRFQIDYIFPQRLLMQNTNLFLLKELNQTFNSNCHFSIDSLATAASGVSIFSIEKLLIVTSSYLNCLREARTWTGTISFGFASLAPVLLIYFYAELRHALARFHHEGIPEKPDYTMNQSITVQ